MASTTGLHIFQDTGAPAGRTDYTTLIVIHGIVWHSGEYSSRHALLNSN